MIELYDRGQPTWGWRGDLVKGIFNDFSWKDRPSWDRLDFVCWYLNCDKKNWIKWFEDTFKIKWENMKSSKPSLSPLKDKWNSLPWLNPTQIEYLKARAIYEVGDWVRDNNWNVCVPIVNIDGVIKSFQSRNINDEAWSRYYVEKSTDSDWVFLNWLDPSKKAIIVVEGLTDYLSLRQYTTNVVGLVNAKNTHQIDIIKELSRRYTIYFSPDNDEAWLTTISKFRDAWIKFNLFKLETYWVKDINEALVNYWLWEEILTIIFSESEKPLSNLRSALNKAKEYKRLYEENWGKLWFPTGQELIDKYTDWFIKWKVYLIIWYSNQGKTRFAYSFIQSLIAQKKKIAFFSLEVDVGMLYLELIGAITWKTKQEIMVDLDNWSDYISEIEEYVEVYDDIRKLDDIEAQIKKNSYDVVFIDFVQNIEQPWDEYARTTEIAIRLQKLAILSWTTLINLSQVNNESRFAEGANIQPKGSWALFASSDVILSLWGREWTKFLTIAKNKYWQAWVNFIINPDYARSIFRLAEDFWWEAKANNNWFTRK